eukprot:765559-Pelagomonas_calceolata.AAC.1
MSRRAQFSSANSVGSKEKKSLCWTATSVHLGKAQQSALKLTVSPTSSISVLWYKKVIRQHGKLSLHRLRKRVG